MWRIIDPSLAGLDPAGLATRLGLRPDDLGALAARAEHSYREILLPKRSGGTRRVAIPEPKLKRAQAGLQELLQAALLAPGCVLGGLRGRSFVAHAERHRGRRFVLTLDLRDFFDRVRPDQVARALAGLGLREDLRALVLDLGFRAGALPQGAPSSPLLANLALAEADRRIQRLARRRGLAYGRYLDDLALSGDQDFRELLGPIAAILRAQGFELAAEKTAYMGRHEPQVVTGLLVNDRLRPTAAFRAELEEELRFLARGRRRPRLEQRVEGRLSHLARFDPRAAESLRRRYPLLRAAATSS